MCHLGNEIGGLAGGLILRILKSEATGSELYPEVSRDGRCKVFEQMKAMVRAVLGHRTLEWTPTVT